MNSKSSRSNKEVVRQSCSLFLCEIKSTSLISSWASRSLEDRKSISKPTT